MYKGPERRKSIVPNVKQRSGGQKSRVRECMAKGATRELGRSQSAGHCRLSISLSLRLIFKLRLIILYVQWEKLTIRYKRLVLKEFLFISI